MRDNLAEYGHLAELAAELEDRGGSARELGERMGWGWAETNCRLYQLALDGVAVETAVGVWRRKKQA